MQIRVSSPVANIRVDCEPEDAEKAVGLAKQLLMETLPAVERLGVANANFKLGLATPPSLTHSESTILEDGTVTAEVSAPAAGKPEKKRRGSSGGGKTANWKIADLKLSEPQIEELKAFFIEKQPKGQNHEVAVLAFKLRDLLNQDTFDGNEIHTALAIVGRKTPANLTAVFNNMKAARIADSKDRKLVVNFLTDNLVKHSLPAKAAPAA
jgi:hypothetical protein